MTESVESRIKRHEGCRLTPYADTLGFMTIGYGRNLSQRGISQDEADLMFANDIARCKEQVIRNVPGAVALDDARKGVLYELCYQMGIAGLMNFRRMLAACQEGDYAAAAEEMLDSRWHNQTKIRCEELAAIMLTGEA